MGLLCCGRPKETEDAQRPFFVGICTVCVVWSIVVIVRDRVMSTCRQELLDVRIHSRMAVSMRITGPAADIGGPEVGVVAQPQHDIRAIFHDGVEDLGSLSVGLSRAVIGRVVHIDTTPRRHSESWRLCFIGPVLLCFEVVGR